MPSNPPYNDDWSGESRNLSTGKVRGVVTREELERDNQLKYEELQRVYALVTHWADETRRLEAENVRLKEDRERLCVQLAGCTAAAIGPKDQKRCKPEDYGYSASYEDVWTLRDSLEAKIERHEASVSSEEWMRYFEPYRNHFDYADANAFIAARAAVPAKKEGADGKKD